MGKKRIFEIANLTNAKLKTMPGMYELMENGFNYSSIRGVDVTDLLGRKEIKLNNKEISEYITEKTVLVTGGGGSIGSELCRQISRLNPKKLIIVDIYENNAYDIQNELLSKFPELDLLVLIASVRDRFKIDAIFDQERPDIVFHAAAHKHVPLMEAQPIEAVKNNLFHIYAVTKIEEGIELLTGVKAGEKDIYGDYEKDSIFYLANNKINEFNKVLKTESEA